MTTPVRQPVEVKTPGMAPLARLPVFFALEGRRVVVAGGSAAAAWKVELLSACGALVDVFADEVSDELQALLAAPSRGAIQLHPRGWAAADLHEAALAVGAFENEVAAHAFAQTARSAGVPVNVIDKPAFCDFSFGSIVNRSPLVIGISTDGAAPVFAQAIRAKLEAFLPQGFSRWAEAARNWRARVKTSGLSFAGRRKVWQLFTALAVQNPNRGPREDDLTTLLDEVRSLGASTELGTVTLVGAGPGDPELLTLRAVRALQSADVILFDDLVSAEVLDFARREARKILVGKKGHASACKQEDINALMVKLACQGRRVVRLKGGDPLIFARATEELDACYGAGISVEIVPGITAAQGAASRYGVSLTGRGKSRRLQFLTGHDRSGALPEDIDWRSVADGSATTVIYMPMKTLNAFVSNAIAAGLDPQTPAVAVSNATRPAERYLCAPIVGLPIALAVEHLDGPVLVMIGSVLEAANATKTISNGAPETIRTSDLCLRRATLYPAELRAPAA